MTRSRARDRTFGAEVFAIARFAVDLAFVLSLCGRVERLVARRADEARLQLRALLHARVPKYEQEGRYSRARDIFEARWGATLCHEVPFGPSTYAQVQAELNRGYCLVIARFAAT
jgi:hypothetical protein